MTPSIKDLLGCLPPYRDEWVLIKDDQSVHDIIENILQAHKDFAPYYDNIALFFDGDTTEEICKNIYNFLKRNISYHEESDKDQTTALPTGILTRAYGDCKHYSSFAGGVLDALNRITGRNTKWNYRFASYDLFNPYPHHVFVVAKDDATNDEIWIDPTPGSKGQVPTWLIDKSINVKKMALRQNIAGFQRVGVVQPVYVETMPLDESQVYAPAIVQQLDETAVDQELTPELQSAIETLVNYGVMNDAGEISTSRLAQLASTLPEDQFNQVAQARTYIQSKIFDAINQASANGQDLNAAIGSLWSDIWRGTKKVTLALPRNAFLSLVAINAFGYATKLYNAIYKDDGSYWQPGQDQLYKKWNSVGGDWHALSNAINSGHKKKAILGCVNCGMGDLAPGSSTGGEGGAIGVAPAIPAWVATASAIIAMIMPLISQILKARQQAGFINQGVNPQTGLPYNMNVPGTTSTDPLQWIKDNPLMAGGIGLGAYYILSPGKKAGAVQRKRSNKKTVGFLLIGGVAAYLLLKKKTDTTGTDTGAGTGADTGTGGSTTDVQPTTTDVTPVTPTATGFMTKEALLPYYDPTFDGQCYLDRYPDLRGFANWSADPYSHYQKYGKYEGRLPSCDPQNVRYSNEFDPYYYLNRYPDLQQKFGSDYAKAYNHWLQYGQNEGRKPGGAYLILS